MEEFWLLILVLFFATNSLDKAKSVQLEELPLKIFDEIFGEGWWDNDKDEEWQKLTLEHNFHHQIDRQNTQLGQIEPNSTEQNPPLTESNHYGQIEPNSIEQNPPLTESNHYGQIEPNSTDQKPPLTESNHYGQIEQNPPLTKSDHSGQIEPNLTDQFGQIESNSTDQKPPLQLESDHYGQIESNSTDQNPPLTESDHFDNAKNGEEMSSNENMAEDERKWKIVAKFHVIKDEFKQKGKYTTKEWTQIERKIAKHLNVSRPKIYEWKIEFGIKRKMHNFEKKKNELKNLVEKFDQKKAELKRAGFNNSYPNQINETVAKELGLSFRTICNWKRELGLTRTNYSADEKLKIVKNLMRVKSDHSGEDKKSCKEIDKEIAERFGVNARTIRQWKKEFGLSRKVFDKKEEHKHLVEKFDQRKAELKRGGLKNSYHELDKTVAKELGLNDRTIYKWKSELGQTTPNHKYSDSEQMELTKRYYEIKDQIPKYSDADISKILKIGTTTLYKWKKQFE